MGIWNNTYGVKRFNLKNYIDIVKNYKYFVYSRFDQFYTGKHPILTGEHIWIPKGEDYFLMTDMQLLIAENFLNNVILLTH